MAACTAGIQPWRSRWVMRSRAPLLRLAFFDWGIPYPPA